MNRVYITCRSQTEALMAYRLLEGAGIRGVMTRPPREDRGSSCAYAVQIRPEELETAQTRLYQKNFLSYKIRMMPV